MEEIEQLLAITENLRQQYGRSFTLDGKLVGDIGEVLAAEKYGLELHPDNTHIHDGIELLTNRQVQVKSSFKNYSYFPYGKEKLPDYFISINISEDGDIEELFNGPGQFIEDHYIKARKLKLYNKTYYTLSKGVLQKLNKEVPEKDKIKVVK